MTAETPDHLRSFFLGEPGARASELDSNFVGCVGQLSAWSLGAPFGTVQPVKIRRTGWGGGAAASVSLTEAGEGAWGRRRVRGSPVSTARSTASGRGAPANLTMGTWRYGGPRGWGRGKE